MKHSIKDRVYILISIVKVWLFLNFKFKGKAFDRHKLSCSYLTDDGRKCFIGLFIPDGHKGQRYAGGYHRLIENYPELIDKMPHKNTLLLGRLQAEHDDLDNISLKEQRQYLFDYYKRMVWEYKWT